MINQNIVISAIQKLKTLQSEIQPRIISDISGISFWLNDAVDVRIASFNKALNESDDSLDGARLVEEELAVIVDILKESKSPYDKIYIERLTKIIFNN